LPFELDAFLVIFGRGIILEEVLIMRDFIILRLLVGLLLVFAVSVLVFSMLHIMPGNPIDLMADSKVSQERLEALKHEYGLDRPLPEQYLSWASKIITKGDFGISLRNRQPIRAQMMQRIPTSLKLCGDRKSTRLNSSHRSQSRMPSSA
jgi:peptide/nickel transport system permease protein